MRGFLDERRRPWRRERKPARSQRRRGLGG
jgi:hypothetical protein